MQDIERNACVSQCSMLPRWDREEAPSARLHIEWMVRDDDRPGRAAVNLLLDYCLKQSLLRKDEAVGSLDLVIRFESKRNRPIEFRGEIWRGPREQLGLRGWRQREIPTVGFRVSLNPKALVQHAGEFA